MGEAKGLRAFEKRAAELREDILRESRTRMEAETVSRRYVGVEIPKLYQSLQDEVKERKTMDSKVLTHSSERIAQLKEALAAEKKGREETEEVLLQMMEQAVDNMQHRILKERAEREATEETLLKPLEDRCYKLDAARQAL